MKKQANQDQWGDNMSRSGYTDDQENTWQYIMWRGRVASSIRGKRGQALLKDILTALDEMPVKRLIAGKLFKTGVDVEFCTLGVLGAKRGIELEKLNPEDYDQVAETFNCASPLAQEIVYMNDEFFDTHTPEQRWQAMRDWVASEIKKEEK